MPLPLQEGTVIGGWAVAIARAIEHYKLDSKELFRANKMNLSQALDTNARFPVTHISNVLQDAVSATGDENFGLMVAKYIRPTSWHALGLSIWASSCMEESYQRLIRYQQMFNTALDIRSEETATGKAILVDFPDSYKPLLHPVNMDAIMATIVLTCRHVAEGQFRPRQVSFIRSAPPHPEGFERLFRCPVTFSAEGNCILIDHDDLTKPLPTRNAELAMMNDRLVQEYLARLDRHDVVNQVYAKLMETLGNTIPDQAQIAQALYMSPRNLQHKLQIAGTSYQEILDQTRKELAVQYLQQSHLSINEISFRLVFSKVGSFTRSFKRWTGHPPSQYRAKPKQQLG